ncbi:MAG: metal ABC transporter substrate-binding protein [Clostridiales Family XIII bacterium]|jgi:zinc transport system substrate-binding protein|nr:metal ABC transporter substrate-binding protein [Clostridiales Family XIII bacterium]
MLAALSLLPALCLVPSCAGEGAGGPRGDVGRLAVVSTVFPSYDFVREIAGDRVENVMLLPPGAESHSFEPTPQDIIRIQDCGLFIYVGGESDRWIGNILDSIEAPRMRVIKMLECVEAVEEEIVEGMEDGEGAGAGGRPAPAAEKSLKEYDEHVWTSPRNAAVIAEAVAEALCETDPSNAAAYRENMLAYKEKLEALDGAFREVVGQGRRKTVVFADRFPFRYLADAYGLDYYAAFPGCATETEASAATVVFLIDKIRAEGIPAVFHTEFSNQRMADVICEETGARKLLLHACHNVSRDDLQGGATYLSLMGRNVESLREGLS